jgi:CRP-like cAMP-binding protein
MPPDELERLSPYFRRIDLKRGERIAGVGETFSQLWFFESGAVSRVVQLLTGETVEAGIVGKDGLLGVPVALGRERETTQCTVQIPGTALTISVADYEEHVRARNSALQQALMLYANLTMDVLSQLTACHCLHRIEQRLSRCLLTLRDHSDGDDLGITHDTLAEFLGVHRPSITYALQAVASDGAVQLQRRRIVVRKRRALEERSCECFNSIRSATRRELAFIAESFAA